MNNVYEYNSRSSRLPTSTIYFNAAGSLSSQSHNALSVFLFTTYRWVDGLLQIAEFIMPLKKAWFYQSIQQFLHHTFLLLLKQHSLPPTVIIRQLFLLICELSVMYKLNSTVPFLLSLIWPQSTTRLQQMLIMVQNVFTT